MSTPHKFYVTYPLVAVLVPLAFLVSLAIVILTNFFYMVKCVRQKLSSAERSRGSLASPLKKVGKIS
jgi:hypothetical protein